MISFDKSEEYPHPIKLYGLNNHFGMLGRLASGLPVMRSAEDIQKMYGKKDACFIHKDVYKFMNLSDCEYVHRNSCSSRCSPRLLEELLRVRSEWSRK